MEPLFHSLKIAFHTFLIGIGSYFRNSCPLKVTPSSIFLLYPQYRQRKARIRAPSKQNTKIISSAISSQPISVKNSESE